MSHMLTTEADKDDGCLLVATLPVSTICVLPHRYLAVVLYTTLRRQNPRAFPVSLHIGLLPIILRQGLKLKSRAPWASLWSSPLGVVSFRNKSVSWV